MSQTINYHKRLKLGSRMLRKLQPRDQPQMSDIDRCFDSPRIHVNDIEDPSWVCNWWKVHRKDYPRMAAAAIIGVIFGNPDL
jgi:hypothetical protein